MTEEQTHTFSFKAEIHIEPCVDTEQNRNRLKAIILNELKRVFDSQPKQHFWHSQAKNIILFTMVLAMTIIAVILNNLLSIDNIVNGVLYQYGLQFSNQWSSPYQVLLRYSMLGGFLLFASFGLVIFVTLVKKESNIHNPTDDLKLIVYNEKLYVFKKEKK